MEQLIEVISIAGYPVLFVLGCVIGYWEKCIQLRIGGLREDLRLATTNTIKDECMGDFPNVPHVVIDNTK